MEPLSRKATIIRIAAVIFVLVLTVFLLIERDRIRDLGALGYPGIFLINLLANATIIVPMPGVIITSALGAVFYPFWVAVAAATGSAVGELSAYVIGFSGQRVIQRAKWHDTVEHWMKKYGNITIFVLSAIPNPAFDVAGITAGAMKIPVARFLLFCVSGKLVKMLFFAFGGASLFNGVLKWFG